MLRNCRDVVPFLCGHYLRLGFERVAFYDDSSTDGTLLFLKELARREPRLRAIAVPAEAIRQEAVITGAANDAIAAGCPVVFPFDSDEFWAIDRHDLSAIAADRSPRVLVGRWCNFLQTRTVLTARPGALFRMRHRWPEANADRDSIVAFRAPFVALPTTKVALVSNAPVEIVRGQHALSTGPNTTEARRLDLFHMPLRNRNEIVKRATDYEPRRGVFREKPGESFQSKFHAEVYAEGRVDEVWAANSTDRRGVVDVYGRPVAAVPDARLARLLIAASVHMLGRYGVIAA